MGRGEERKERENEHRNVLKDFSLLSAAFKLYMTAL
jgi:hypothetical protein